MQPLFSLKFTIFLATALFLPFLMRTANFKLEPYPAVILPSGSEKLNLQEGIIDFNNLLIYGYDTQGKLQKIATKELIAPIPNQYIYAIATKEFGLSSETTDELLLRGVNKNIKIERKLASYEEREFAKLWLSNRLRDLGLSSSFIIVRRELKKLEINTGKEVSTEINNEKYILLR